MHRNIVELVNDLDDTVVFKKDVEKGGSSSKVGKFKVNSINL